MRRVLMLAALAVVASACRIDANVGIDLARSADVGDLFVTLETDEEFEELFAITDRDFEDFLAERGAEIGLTFRVVEESSGAIYTTRAEGLSYEAVENILSRMAPGLGELGIAGRDGVLEIDAELASLLNLDDVAPFFTDFDPTEFQDDVGATLTITVPGEVTASSADSISGNTYRWDLPFGNEATRVIVRSSVDPDGGGDLPWALIIALAVLVMAIGFLIVIRSTLTRNAEDEETTTPAALRSIPPEEQRATQPEIEEPPSIPPEDQPFAPVDQAGS